MIDHSRRRILIALAAIAGSSVLPSIVLAKPEFNSNPFTCGVASGSPASDGFVIWTRLEDSSLNDLQAVEVNWEVYDEGKVLIASGKSAALQDLGFSVHVEVSGLKPNKWYSYRFIAGHNLSTEGKSRTLPLSTDNVDRFKFAYASCQKWEDGFYAAYKHMLKEEPDMVVFLGDYIYESKFRSNGVRTHPYKRVKTLQDYRQRYALYKSDLNLQAMHAACPWLVTWDDHEVENNYAGTFSVRGSKDFTSQRVAAYQAFYENMPIRASAMLGGLSEFKRTGALKIYQSTSIGNLVRIHLLDDRQYRDAPWCGRLDALPPDQTEPFKQVCVVDDNTNRTILGTEQEQWLANSLHQAANDGVQWNVIAQQTVFTPRNYSKRTSVYTDAWDGYPSARERLIASIVKARPRNPLFIGGDIHAYWVARVHQNPYDISSPVVASEFCGTSIASANQINTPVQRPTAPNLKSPHCLLSEKRYRGYGVIELTPAQANVNLMVVNNAADENSGITKFASFKVAQGGFVERVS